MKWQHLADVRSIWQQENYISFNTPASWRFGTPICSKRVLFAYAKGLEGHSPALEVPLALAGGLSRGHVQRCAWAAWASQSR